MIELLSNSNSLLLSDSWANYGCNGLYCLTLKQNGPFKTRLFVCSTEHKLWKNNLRQSFKTLHPITIPVHSHKTDIEVKVVNGFVWSAEFSPKTHAKRQDNEFKFTKFVNRKKVGTETLRLKHFRSMTIDQTHKFPSDVLHTVYVTKWQNSAWVVQESAPSEDYDGIFYTMQDEFIPTERIRLSEDQIRDVLKLINLNLYDTLA